MRDRGVAAPLSVQSPTVTIAWSDQHPAQNPGQPCVTLPFTAPSLIQMRARRSRQGGLEMLLSNPSGGRGLYVSSWSALRRYASPSLHDIMLAERIEASAASEIPLTTATIRTLAIEVAAEGHAGRKLAQAARRARSAEAVRMQRMQAYFVLRLAHAVLPNHGTLSLPEVTLAGSEADTDWLASAAQLLAPHFGGQKAWEGADLAKAITDLARLAAPLGRDLEDETAPVQRTRQLLAAAGALRNGSARGAGSSLAAAADLLLQKTDAARLRGHRACEDPLALLIAARRDPAGTAGLLQEATCLLDGCDRLCLLAPGSEEQARFAQILLLENENAATTASSAIAGPRRPVAACTDTASLRLRELLLLDPEIDLCQILDAG